MFPVISANRARILPRARRVFTAHSVRYSMTFPENGDEGGEKRDAGRVSTRSSQSRVRIGRSAKGIPDARHAIRSLK